MSLHQRRDKEKGRGKKKIKECCPSILFEYHRCWAQSTQKIKISSVNQERTSNARLHPVWIMT